MIQSNLLSAATSFQTSSQGRWGRRLLQPVLQFAGACSTAVNAILILKGVYCTTKQEAVAATTFRNLSKYSLVRSKVSNIISNQI